MTTEMRKNFSWCLVCWGKEFTQYACTIGEVRVYGNKGNGYAYQLNRTENELVWKYAPIIKTDYVPKEDSRSEVLKHIIDILS